MIGGHTHRVQPVISYKGKVIAFSLGNFLFPDRYINKPRPTYYPDKDEDRSKYPVTDVYPYVEEPTFKIWKELGRIGMILNVAIDDHRAISTNIVYTRLSRQNVLGVASNEIVQAISRPLARVSFFLRFGKLYKYLYEIKSCLGHIKHGVFRILKK